MIGIFNARVVIAKKDGRLEVTLDGATDAAGFGEALGFAAACWLESSDKATERDFLIMLGAFATIARERGAKSVSGSVEILNTGGTIPPGGRVS